MTTSNWIQAIKCMIFQEELRNTMIVHLNQSGGSKDMIRQIEDIKRWI